MGYAFCTSECYGCKRIFSYNPVLVPSVNINGSRAPVCGYCIAQANPVRIANGLGPIIPHPQAYEPCDEGELP